MAPGLLVGAKPLPASVIADALFWYLSERRLHHRVLMPACPRTLAGLFAGGALGLAGALMQTLTRNPLADPAFWRE